MAYLAVYVDWQRRAVLRKEHNAKRKDRVEAAPVLPLCTQPRRSRILRTSPVRLLGSWVLRWCALCHGAHAFASHRNVLRSLRDQMRLREGYQTQGRGIEPRPMEEVGHSTGRGSQWCNRLPAMPPRHRGRKGLRVVGIRFLAPTGSYMKHVS
jgi:hypothetical protein